MELALLSSPSLPPNEEDRFSLIQKLEQDSFEQMIDLNKTKVRENFSQQIQLFDLAKFSLKRQQSLATQDSRKLLIEKTQERAIKNTQLPIKITWKDLSYTIQVKDTYNGLKGKIPLQILKNCTGYALPGQTLYIMGASGAGKTSLMNAIADRIKLSNGAQLTGEVMLNDRFQLSQQLFGSCCAYVMQDDILFETFTVKEALTFAARLKLNFSKDKQDDRIATLLKQLGLEKCQDTQIGSVYKKTISGGERKRCSIGVELIADPSVILLDEPTSGLDSFMAKQICKLSQQLAHEQGKTVITTIHQPSSEAFSFFDRLLLMSDGNTVYQGLACEAPTYFQSIGFKFSKFSNPTDIFMKVLSVNYPKQRVDDEKLEHLLSSYYKNQRNCILLQMSQIRIDIPDTQELQRCSASLCNQFVQLWQRNVLFIARQPSVLFASIGMAIFNGLIVLALYYNQFYVQPIIIFTPMITREVIEKTVMVQIQNSFGFLFILIMQIFLAHSYSTMLTFQIEKPVFAREYSSKLYSLPIYFLTKIIFEIPMIVVAPLVELIIVYWGAGCQQNIARFMQMYSMLLLLAFSGAAIGLFVGSLSNNTNQSSALAAAFTLPIILLSGLAKNLSTMPAWWGWLQYLSPSRFALNGLLISQWSNSLFKPVYTDLQGYGQINLVTCAYSIIALSAFFLILALVSLRLKVDKF